MLADTIDVQELKLLAVLPDREWSEDAQRMRRVASHPVRPRAGSGAGDARALPNERVPPTRSPRLIC